MNRTRSVTPLGGRITINRTIGIKTPPRSKKPPPSARYTKPRGRLDAVVDLVKQESETVSSSPVAAAKPRRRSSVEDVPRKVLPKKSSVNRSALIANRLIKRKTRELKAQRRRDKYQEQFLRQQALALERLTRLPFAADSHAEKDSNNKKAVERQQEEAGREREEQEIKEEQRGEQPELDEQEGEDLASVSDLLDSPSEAEVTGAKVLPNLRTKPSRQAEFCAAVDEAVGPFSEARGPLGEARKKSKTPAAEAGVRIHNQSFSVFDQKEVTKTESPSADRLVYENAPVKRDDVDKETEVVAVAPVPRCRTARRKSSAQSGRQPRVIKSLAEKPYSARFLVASGQSTTKKRLAERPRYRFTDLDYDDRDLVEILQESSPPKAVFVLPIVETRWRVGEPTFEEPDRSEYTGGPAAQMTEILSRMRRGSRIAQRRSAVLCRRVSILSKNCYWTPIEGAAKESPAKKAYSSFTLAPDQIRLVFCIFNSLH